MKIFLICLVYSVSTWTSTSCLPLAEGVVGIVLDTAKAGGQALDKGAHIVAEAGSDIAEASLGGATRIGNDLINTGGADIAKGAADVVHEGVNVAETAANAALGAVVAGAHALGEGAHIVAEAGSDAIEAGMSGAALVGNDLINTGAAVDAGLAEGTADVVRVGTDLAKHGDNGILSASKEGINALRVGFHRGHENSGYNKIKEVDDSREKGQHHRHKHHHHHHHHRPDISNSNIMIVNLKEAGTNGFLRR